jgi:hypothetical protein
MRRATLPQRMLDRRVHDVDDVTGAHHALVINRDIEGIS